ncbi:hypothetical protein ACHAQJ_005810 [Trichoderma viride]
MADTIANYTLQESTCVSSVGGCPAVFFACSFIFGIVPSCTVLYLWTNPPNDSPEGLADYQCDQRNLLIGLIALEIRALFFLAFDERILGSCMLWPVLSTDIYLMTLECCWMLLYRAIYEPLPRHPLPHAHLQRNLPRGPLPQDPLLRYLQEDSVGEAYKDAEDYYVEDDIMHGAADEYEPPLHEWRAGYWTSFDNIRQTYGGETMSSSTKSRDFVMAWLLATDSGYGSS